jgi:hypothetical protein
MKGCRGEKMSVILIVSLAFNAGLAGSLGPTRCIPPSRRRGWRDAGKVSQKDS